MAYIGSTPAPQMPEVGTGAVETQDIQDGAVTAAKLAPGAAVPSQTGNSAKYLTTDGTTSSWGPAVASFNTRTGAVTLSSGDVTGALGFTPYNSTNPSGYISSITGSNVTTALGFTPYNATNPNGYISSITSGNVTTALGFTPYNATNPSGYTTNTGTVTNVGGTGTVSGLTLTGSVSTTGNLTLGGTLSLTSGNVTTALGFTPENSANRGTANGYASLDGSGLVPSTQLPSYVDDVLEYANLAGFPATGTTGKIYVAIDTNKTYRWSGSAYVYITSGAVDSVAGKTGVVSLVSSDVGLGNVENKSSATIRGEISSANVTAALGFTPYNATNPSGYITTSALSGYLTSATAASTYQPIGSYLTGITSGQVTTALGFTPYNSSNPSGYITGITSANVTTALGFTPYNATNPSGYITSSALSPYLTSSTASSTYLPLTGGTLSGAVLTQTAASSWGVYSKTSGYENHSGIWFSSNVGELLLRNAAGGLVTRIAADGSYAFINGNNILHAGNYTSYSPALTGNYKNIGVGSLYSRYHYSEGAHIDDSTSAYTLSPDYGSTTVAMHNSHGSFGGWATTLTMSGYERYGAYQISGDYNANPAALAIRNYNQALAGWTPWVRMLSSANYTSYAMPSGSSATNSVDVRAPIFYDSDNTSYYIDPNGSTSASLAGSVGLGTTGPINSAWGTASNTRQLFLYGSNYSLINLRADNLASTYYSMGAGNGRFYAAYDNNAAVHRLTYYGSFTGFNNITNPQYNIHLAGTGYASDDWRAPIFYDSNNTSYYVDPNNFSRAVSFAIGNQGSLIGSDTTYPASIYHNARYLLGLRFSGSGTSNYPWLVHDQWNGDALIFHFNGIADRFRFSSGGIGHAEDSFRAPAFYDSNNSAYYVDPASQSNLDTVRISRLQQGKTTTFDWGNILTGGYYHGYGAGNVARHEIMRIGIDYNDWNSVGSVIIELSENYYATGGYSKWYVFYGYVNSGGAQLMEANGNWQGSSITVGSPVQVSGDQYYLPVYANVQGYYQVSGRVTTTRDLTVSNPPAIGNTLILTTPNITNPSLSSAPVPSYGVFNGSYMVDNLYTQVVYDSGNTGYYVDPASTTNLNALTLNGVEVTAGGGGTSAFVAFGSTGGL